MKKLFAIIAFLVYLPWVSLMQQWRRMKLLLRLNKFLTSQLLKVVSTKL